MNAIPSAARLVIWCKAKTQNICKVEWF